MNDPHRQPRSGDRDAVMDRIRRAADEGRIGAADRDIRLGNVRSAQSMAELDLITRDLDLLESTFAPGSAPAAPAPAAAAPEASYPPPAAAAEPAAPALPTRAVLDAGKNVAKRVAIRFVMIATLGIVVAAVFTVGLFRTGDGGGSGDSGTVLPEPVPIISEDPGGGEDPGSDPGSDPGAEPGEEEPDPAYRLDGPGIRAFLAAYRAKFDTTRVVDLTLYDDYVIARVPIAGKKRNQGWLYRPGEGWSDFGGIQADFPGSEVVDTARLDIAKLLANIGRARRTLGVEEYSLTYVTIDYRPGSDDVPNVNIYVSNEFHESGYLATTLDGRIERAYPFAG